MKSLSKCLILALMIDSAWVAYGLYKQKVMWAWIVTYWIILTIKNFVDYYRLIKED